MYARTRPKETQNVNSRRKKKKSSKNSSNFEDLNPLREVIKVKVRGEIKFCNEPQWYQDTKKNRGLPHLTPAKEETRQPAAARPSVLLRFRRPAAAKKPGEDTGQRRWPKRRPRRRPPIRGHRKNRREGETKKCDRVRGKNKASGRGHFEQTGRG